MTFTGVTDDDDDDDDDDDVIDQCSERTRLLR